MELFGGLMKRIFLITVIFLASFLLDGSVFGMAKDLSYAEKCYLKKLDESYENAKKECTKDEILMSSFAFSGKTSSVQALKNAFAKKGYKGLILMEPVCSMTSLTSLITNSKVDKASIEYFLSFSKVRDVLINCPSNFNIKYNTPLFFALSMNRIYIMKLLVKHGALVCLDYLERQINYYFDYYKALSITTNCVYLTSYDENQIEDDFKKGMLVIKKTFEDFKKWYKNQFLNKNITSSSLSCLKNGFLLDVKFKFD